MYRKLEPFDLVAVNCGYGTCFGYGLVIGYADCECFVGLVETSKVVSIVSLAFVRHTASRCLTFPALKKERLHLQNFVLTGHSIHAIVYIYIFQVNY